MRPAGYEFFFFANLDEAFPNAVDESILGRDRTCSSRFLAGKSRACRWRGLPLL